MRAVIKAGRTASNRRGPSTEATSPIILSRRIGEPSPGLTHCLHLIAQLRSEIGREHPIVS